MKQLILIPAIAATLATMVSAGDSCSASKSPATTAAWGEKSTIVETAVAAGDFGTLATALRTAGLVEALSGEGPFTVFAPTDAAFARLPKGTVEGLLKPESRDTLTNILTYHVVPGLVPASAVVDLEFGTALNGQRFDVAVTDGGVRVAGVQVVKTDIECSNGIIHVIDAVMMPSAKDIVATAVEAGTFRTLVAALKAAELVEVLQGKGPFTVFAPTDEAFAALPEGTVASLLKPENRDKLVSILKYHVVSGRVYSDQLSNGKVATLSGSKLTVDLHDGARINDARVAVANLDTTNGVVHVIDRVLLPR